MISVDYLIIGGGVAGTTAAETVRKLDANGTIIIVSEEPYPLYSRVLLPHYINSKVKREAVFLKSEKFYEEKAITLLKGRLLQSLNPLEHEAIIDDGTIYRYRKLLIATGGRARQLPLKELAGISYFRTLEDADRIVNDLAAITKLPTNEQVGVVYGGGFIGLEYAPMFKQRHIETHWVVRSQQFWSSYFDAASDQVLATIFAEQDIHLHRGVDYVKVNGDERLESITLSNARIPAKIMGIGVGLIPNFETVQVAGIKTNQGIVTNEFLQTNAPDVWAAGDVAEFFDLTVNRSRTLKNWVNAQQQGLRAASNMVGDRKPFEIVSSYSASPFGVTITFVGDIEQVAGTTVIGRGQPELRSVGQIFVRNNKVVGTTLINMNRDRTPLTTLIQTKKDIRGQETKLADPEFDIKNLI